MMSKDFKIAISLAVGSLAVLIVGAFPLFNYLNKYEPNPFKALAISIYYVLIGVGILFIEYVGIIIWAISKTARRKK